MGRESESAGKTTYQWPQECVSQRDVTRFDGQYRPARGTGGGEGPDPVSARGGVYCTLLQMSLYTVVREMWHVPPAPKPPLYRADYCCRAACCVRAVSPLKGHCGAGSSRTSGCSYPHSSPVKRADSVRNCWHCRWGKGKVVGQPKAKLAIQ